MLAIDWPWLVGWPTSDDRDWHGLRRNKLGTATSETSCTGRSPDCEGTAQLPYGGNELSNRALRLNQIGGTIRERRIGHVCPNGLDPICQPFTSGNSFQLLQERLVNVYRRDDALGGPGQDQRCHPCTASEIDNAGRGRQPIQH